MTAGPTQARTRARLYVVATSHLDTQWRWTVRDAIREFLPYTLDENFARFEKFPSYVLSFEGAFRYQLLEEYYPERFERLRSLVAAGRWFPAGSMLDAPDVNIVSPESLIRHVLYGSHYFEQRFGTTGLDVFLPDCFGFSWSLPSIAAHCGLEGFSSSKLVRWMKGAKKPFDLGVWEGPDGARILCSIHPGGYGERLEEEPSRSIEWQQRVERAGAATGVFVGHRYFGVGDRGGAADEESLGRLERSLSDTGPLEIIHGGSDRLFRDLPAEQIGRLPVHCDELQLPTHGTGCWTSQAAMKRWNRRCEQLATATERATALAAWLGAIVYPVDMMRSIWTGFLWHQMHDDLTGTSIPEAYRLSWNDQLVAINRLETGLTAAVGAIARGLDTRGVESSIPLVVYNPSSVGREDPVEAEVRFDGPPPRAIRVVDSEGQEVFSQIVQRKTDALSIVFLAAVDSVGLTAFWVEPTREKPPWSPASGSLRISESGLENHCYRVDVSAAGEVTSVFDKRLGCELLQEPLTLELLPDSSRRWPAWEILYRDIAARPGAFGGHRQIKIEENGPVRVVLGIETRHGRSLLRQRLRLYSGNADQAAARLEIECDLEWRTRSRILKASFPFAFGNPTATYDLGLGAIRRGNNHRLKYEVPAQQWADLSAVDGSHGVSILSDSRYGWDKPDDSTLRLTLVRSPGGRHKFRHQRYQDHGRHRLTYAIFSHPGSWAQAGSAAQAERLNQPLRPFQTDHHNGPLGRSIRFVEVEPSQVAVRALKRSEDSADWIVRLAETSGQPRANVRFSAGAGLLSAREVDGRERPRGTADLSGGGLSTRLESFQPRTFAFELASPETPLRPLETQALELPFDLQATSFHSRTTAPTVDFDGKGNSLPGELLPARIKCGEVAFSLARDERESANCVRLEGQRVAIPPGFDVAYLLAASVSDAPRRVEFRVENQPVSVTLDPYSGFIGQRNRWPEIHGFRVGREQPGYLRTTPIAWVGTHRHGPGDVDQPYVFCYLYSYELEIPTSGTELVFPTDPDGRVFAITLARQGQSRLNAASNRRD
ncbi:MAG: alpha-mannosidase [Acidobacteriota bacterium]|nr:alpha-mannosidase [Acidobacteriota bacterium]